MTALTPDEIRRLVRRHLGIREPEESPEDAAKRITKAVFAAIPEGAFCFRKDRKRKKKAQP